MRRFGLITKFTAFRGRQEYLAEILVNAGDEMEELEGCQFYIVNLANERDTDIYVYELWESQEAHQDSLTLNVTQALIQKAKPYINSVERICTLTPVGDKGGI